MSNYRNHERFAAVLAHGGVKACKCDMCGKNAGAEYHEIIARNRTQGNEQALELSYSRYICALLCGTCHRGDSHNAQDKGVADALLRKNIRRYGRENVLKAFRAVEELLSFPLDIEFPED
jgi:NAD-dependent SIR2 family protein deacetylase